MISFRRLAGTALVAGVIAGLALSAARQAWVIPLILQAEEIEFLPSLPAARDGQTTPPDDREARAAAAALPREWQPAAGFPRHAWTWTANALTGFGFALLLVAGYGLSGRPVHATRGLLWGLAGFAAASLAPALGLPPALPGAPEADLAARQVWWLAAVAAATGGLALLAFARRPWLRLLGLPLLALPHLIRAPRTAEPLPAALADLAPRFIAATLLTNLGFWLLLGLLSGWMWGRTAQRADPGL